MASVFKKDSKRSVKNDVLCCRACLATEGKLVNMLEHKLSGEFFRVSGITFQGRVKLPHHLCVWCTAFMQKCATFRAKCLRATECLQACLLMGDLTTDAISTIDRQALQLVDLTKAKIETVNINGCNMPVVLNPVSTVHLNDIQDDTNKRDVKNDLYIQIDSVNKNEIKIDVVKESDIMDMNNEDDDMFEVQYLDDEIYESNAELESEVIIEPANDHVKKEEVEVNISEIRKRNSEKCMNTEVKNKRRKNNNDKENTVNTEEGKRGITAGKWRSAKDGFMPKVNLEKFKDTCDVDIVILTREEQLAEIEARRASSEYKTAPYPCEPCGKYYQTEDAYNNHKAKHSKKVGPYQCPVCKIRFKWRSTRWQHCDTHRFKFICRLCGFVSRMRHQAKQHYQYHAGKRYQCGYCLKVFSKLSSYSGHLRLAHRTMNRACGMCGETFVNVRQHMASRHGVSRKRQDMECKTCAVTFVSTHALQKHKMAAGEKHTKMLSCVQCGENFTSEDAMKIHVDEEHPSCLDCNATFLNASSYNTHVDRKHRGLGNHISQERKQANTRAKELGLPAPYPAPRPKPGANYVKPRKVVCDHCGKIFANVSLLRYHLRKLRGEKLKHACPHCPSSFYYNKQLQAHLRVHTGEKPYKCDQCDTVFSLKWNLRRHVLNVHMGICKKAACEICGRLFTTPSSVKLHVRTVHNGEPGPKRAPRKKKTKKYKNEIARRRELGLPAPYHQQYTHGEFYGKPAKVICHHCGKIFANSTLLRYHLDQLRGKKMKFACPHCPKSFWSNVTYQVHLRVHTGEKPYECDDCGTAFTIKGNLRRHVLNVHLGISKKSVCDICGRLFSTPSSVKLHVRTVHNGEPWPKRAPREKKTEVVSESSTA